MSPISWPESSTVADLDHLWRVGQLRLLKARRHVAHDVSGGWVVPRFEPVMRTTQRAGSHDGGETS